MGIIRCELLGRYKKWFEEHVCILSHVWLSVTPWIATSQAPLSMGFSRQEHWSGLLCLPPGDLPNLGIELRSLTLWADSLLSEPPGKPKNFGVGNLSLLQGIFPTQESNWDLLHCRWILYQLSYQGSPNLKNTDIEVAQSCLTLCDPMDCSRPGSSVHEIFKHYQLIFKQEPESGPRKWKLK